MQVISTINEIQQRVKDWKKEGLTVGFVPTMGALHIGHLSLIKEAKKVCDKVVVSIFVNPIQFGPNEDFDNYPRTLDNDKKACQDCGVDLVFVPATSELYPDFKDSKKSLTTIIPPQDYVNKLCGKLRKGHFDGVATVVLKFFNIVQPDKAFFGQKDAQQLIIIKKVCKDLNVPVEVIGCPIIREIDGLACSSRNSYLSSEDREKAPTLNKVLKKVVELYNDGKTNKNEVFKEALEFLDKSFSLEYLEVYDVNTLEYKANLDNNSLIAIAAKISSVRLIDNVIINE